MLCLAVSCTGCPFCKQETLILFGRLTVGKAVTDLVLRKIVPAQMWKALLGYNWAFDSLAEAQSSAASYLDCGP